MKGERERVEVGWGREMKEDIMTFGSRFLKNSYLCSSLRSNKALLRPKPKGQEVWDPLISLPLPSFSLTSWYISVSNFVLSVFSSDV